MGMTWNPHYGPQQPQHLWLFNISPYSCYSSPFCVLYWLFSCWSISYSKILPASAIVVGKPTNWQKYTFLYHPSDSTGHKIGLLVCGVVLTQFVLILWEINLQSWYITTSGCVAPSILTAQWPYPFPMEVNLAYLRVLCTDQYWSIGFSLGRIMSAFPLFLGMMTGW